MACGIRIMTSSSKRRGIVGIGGALHNTLSIVTGREPITYSVTLGARTELNPYVAELAAIAMATKRLPPSKKTDHYLHKQSRSPAYSEPTKTPIRATYIEEIYEAARILRKGGNSISIVWVPSQGNFDLGKRAKEVARQATEQDRTPQGQC